MRVCPGVHGNVIAQVELLYKSVGIVSDVAPNHKVCHLLIVRFQKLN
jgi:hypothetical protein